MSAQDETAKFMDEHSVEDADDSAALDFRGFGINIESCMAEIVAKWSETEERKKRVSMDMRIPGAAGIRRDIEQRWAWTPSRRPAPHELWSGMLAGRAYGRGEAKEHA